MQTVLDFTKEEAFNALEENLWNMWANFGKAPGCSLHEEEHALWFETPIPIIPYNGVLRFNAQDDIDKEINSIIKTYLQRGVPYMWILHPSAKPDDLKERLLKRGLMVVDNLPGMVADLDELPMPEVPPTGYDIFEVKEEADIINELEMISWRWHFSDETLKHFYELNQSFKIGKQDAILRVWTAFCKGKPVSKVVLHLSAGAAGIYGVATKPEARGKGLARILTLQALWAARKIGYKIGILHSSEMAVNLYKKIGFKTVSNFTVLASDNVSI
jgi:GNAT superfamily N-acetyltransferase